MAHRTAVRSARPPPDRRFAASTLGPLCGASVLGSSQSTCIEAERGLAMTDAKAIEIRRVRGVGRGARPSRIRARIPSHDRLHPDVIASRPGDSRTRARSQAARPAPQMSARPASRIACGAPLETLGLRSRSSRQRVARRECRSTDAARSTSSTLAGSTPRWTPDWLVADAVDHAANAITFACKSTRAADRLWTALRQPWRHETRFDGTRGG